MKRVAVLLVTFTVVFVSVASATDWLWQVTTYPGSDGLPSWSPAGASIAFTSGRSGNWDIWAIKPEYTSIVPASLGEIKVVFR
ncbi:MAG: PD40 domain-containing protein [Candidatus Coatesbacteria bacterium]|nr:MAG: PD40 domain-containing protein [Candidatus Coatesbacteria bacterium]